MLPGRHRRARDAFAQHQARVIDRRLLNVEVGRRKGLCRDGRPIAASTLTVTAGAVLREALKSRVESRRVVDGRERAPRELSQNAIRTSKNNWLKRRTVV
jgi:hypothetical protein